MRTASSLVSRLLVFSACSLLLAAAAPGQESSAVPKVAPWTRVLDAPPDTETVRNLVLRSEMLSGFWGRDVFFQATAVLPADHSQDEALPVVYRVHGFGGNHLSRRRRADALVQSMVEGELPRMLHVFLNANCPLGHHVFADSANNGPWGTALVQEFVPWCEGQFGAYGGPEGRFLTGHSSGGWTTMWLQVAYPDHFGGTWPTAPDSVDFRDFTGVDVYGYENAYRDPDGDIIQLVRRNGEWVASIQDFVAREEASSPIGGQMQSFDAVFSPRGDDGRPMPMFDRETGAIDRAVAHAWEVYDIRLVVERDPELQKKLAGKVNLYIGTQDTFRLEGASMLLAESFAELGIESQFVFAEGRDHGNLFNPHPDLWPDGLMVRILNEMQAQFEAGTR